MTQAFQSQGRYRTPQQEARLLWGSEATAAGGGVKGAERVAAVCVQRRRSVAKAHTGHRNRHMTHCGNVDIYAIVKALADNGFDGYVRPDHGRNIFGEDAKPGYGLFDRALGATYISGLFEAIEKMKA